MVFLSVEHGRQCLFKFAMGNTDGSDAPARASSLFVDSITGKVNPVDSNVASGFASIILRLTASSVGSDTQCLTAIFLAESVSLTLTKILVRLSL